ADPHVDLLELVNRRNRRIVASDRSRWVAPSAPGGRARAILLSTGCGPSQQGQARGQGCAGRLGGGDDGPGADVERLDGAAPGRAVPLAGGGGGALPGGTPGDGLRGGAAERAGNGEPPLPGPGDRPGAAALPRGARAPRR